MCIRDSNEPKAVKVEAEPEKKLRRSSSPGQRGGSKQPDGSANQKSAKQAKAKQLPPKNQQQDSGQKDGSGKKQLDGKKRPRPADLVFSLL